MSSSVDGMRDGGTWSDSCVRERGPKGTPHQKEQKKTTKRKEKKEC